MSNNKDLLERLEAYRAKQERGEELTEEQQEQLAEDIELMVSSVQKFASTLLDLQREILKPFIENFDQLEETDVDIDKSGEQQ